MKDDAISDLPPAPLAPSAAPHPRAALTFRSITLGLAGGVLICCLAPYNDFVVNNTYLIGNNLPVIVVMILFGLAVLVNGPLNRWAPNRALSSGELTVITVMIL